MPPKDMYQGFDEAREIPVLGPGQTIESVNDLISDAVLKKPYTKGWLLGAAIGFGMVQMLLVAVAYLLFKGPGIWGDQPPDHVGLRDHQLRLVDRHRPRRDLDLGDPPPAEAAVADVDQSVRGGDDAVRRGLRRDVPAAPHGAPLVLLLDGPVPEHDGALAAVPEPAGLGTSSRSRPTGRSRPCSGTSA